MNAPAPTGLPVRTRLPRVWPGYVLALGFFGVAAGELIIDPSSRWQPSALQQITWLIGYIYWFVCVHAFHRVMGEATGGAHPISPRRAVGFHFIPFFNLYWVFRWTNALVAFVNPRLPASADMARGWAGVAILAALLLARWDGGLALLVLFGLASYLRSKIRQATEAAPGWPRWDGAVAAGLGASFGYVLFKASVEFWHLSWYEWLESLLVMAVVALGIIKFLEPLVGRLRRLLGVTEEHAKVPAPARSRALVRVVAVIILAVASVSHTLLHEWTKENLGGVLAILVVGLLIPGGITYAWVLGARRPRRAAILGAASGSVLGALFLFNTLVVVAALEPLGVPSMPLPPLHDFERGVILNGLAWGFLGLAGGLVIDFWRGPRPAWSVAAALVLAAILADLPALRFGFVAYGPEDFAKIVGWGLGLIAYPRSNRLFTVARQDPVSTAPLPESA
ncbi:MAG TPA: hypothetical protein VIF59_16410 [Methylomirabilota bacterium]|jgi:hypothetical protein